MPGTNGSHDHDHDHDHDHSHAHDGQHAEAHDAQPVSPALQPYRGLTGSGAQFDGPVAIVGARLIDGSGADPVDDAVLVFEGERITAAGRRDTVAIPRDAAILDAAGKT